MDHQLQLQQSYTGLPGTRSLGLFGMTLGLHLVCVVTGKYDWHSLAAFISHFGVESLVSISSGIGSVATAWVLVKHYLLRNKILKQELKDKQAELDAKHKELEECLDEDKQPRP